MAKEIVTRQNTSIQDWNYESSVETARKMVTVLKRKPLELVRELYKASQVLSGAFQDGDSTLVRHR